MAASAGSTPANFDDLSGRKFGRFLVLAYAGDRKWLCLCDCSSEKVVAGYSLKAGVSTSCGCFRSEKVAEKNSTHNLSKTKFYKLWVKIKQRCYCKTNSDYRLYGARGIRMCREWRDSPEAFVAWCMSQNPRPGLSIDRRDNDKGYWPSNCRFVTSSEQASNRRNPIYWERRK